MKQTIEIIDCSIQTKNPLNQVSINAAKVVNAHNDKELMKSIIDCDIINADGVSIILASRILHKRLPERVTGIDLMQELVKLADKNKYKIFFLGAKEEIVTKVVEIYSKKYSKEIIAGYRNGYYKNEEEMTIVEQIANSNAHILFVAMTSPKKEIFLNTYKKIIQTPFIMGVGGSFDVVSGFIKRAPKWMQNSGLEWLFRVMQEPKRMWKRYLFGNSMFIYLVFKQLIKQIFSRV